MATLSFPPFDSGWETYRVDTETLWTPAFGVDTLTITQDTGGSAVNDLASDPYIVNATGSTTVVNGEVTLRWKFDDEFLTIGTGIAVWFRLPGSGLAGVGVRLYGSKGASPKLRTATSYSTVDLGSTESNISDFQDGVWYRLRARLDDDPSSGTDTRVRARAWVDGATEPTEWTLDAVTVSGDTYGASGLVGFGTSGFALQSGGTPSRTFTVSEFTVQSDELPLAIVAADAGDRLRSSISETTGSLLEAVDARAVDASVSEAYTYAQELPATTLVTYREVLRERDSATADFAYYPQPRPNIVMENQYTGLTILGRLARYYPPRIYNDVVSLGLSGIPAATATDIIDYVLTQWAADNDWLTFETVPDLRVPMPGLVPSDYGVGTGQVYASTIAIKQDGNNRRDALTILRDLLSPFPGTVVRQNSAGNLEIVPASGPDADETPFVTLDTKDLYSVTIGKPNEFDTINRCVVSSTGGAVQSTDVAVMQPAWFQLGSSYQFGRANWYSPPVDRLNLQPFDDATDDTLQEGLTTSSNFNLQKPVLWPISGDAIPAGDGISLVDSGAVEQVTIAWARYFNDSLVSSGTNGLTIVTDVIPFSGAWVDALSVSFTTGGESVFANIRMRWNETEQGIEIALGTAKLETDCFTGCNGVIIEFVLGDASVGYAEGSAVTAAFGFVGDDPDILPGVSAADAVLESQTALGIVERRIDIRGYVFDATTLYQIARGYVLNNITPKVTRELDVAALSGYRVLFDNIGRIHQLPSGDVGFLTGVTYTDDFVSGIVRKTATVEVRDLAAAGAVDTTTDYLLMDDGSFWQSDDGSLSEAP